MGCDIHLYSESRHNGVWVADKLDTYDIMDEGEEGLEEHTYPDMETSYHGRNYKLFGLLHAKVRTNWGSSFLGRGIPNNVSAQIGNLYRWWDSDAHSPSYLTVQELREKYMELMLLPASEDREDLLSSLKGLIQGLPDTGVSPEHQRIVFWFDN